MGIKIFGQNGISSDHIFVYCDLKHKGKLNHILVASGCTFSKKGTLKGFQMFNVLNSYPVIVNSRGNPIIQGEIWAIGHPKLFDSLDNIKSPMARNIFEIESGKQKIPCWVYFTPDIAFNQDASGVRFNKEGKWKV